MILHLNGNNIPPYPIWASHHVKRQESGAKMDVQCDHSSENKKTEAFPRMKPGSISYHRMSPGFLFSFAFFFFCLFFRAILAAYGGSQARG